MSTKFLQKELKSEHDTIDFANSLAECDTKVKVPSNFGVSAEDRKRTCYTYMLTGSATKTSEITGFDRKTIYTWRQTDWWRGLTSEAKDLHAEQLDNSFTRLLDTLSTEIEDRLLRGDEVITKGGQKIRKQLSARDMATILGILFDKRQINRNAPTSISRSGSEGQLEKLAQKFGELAHSVGHRPGDDARIIDGEAETVNEE